MHFVVIGGDAAGMSAASRARRHDPSLDITVLEQSADVSYSACNMPYNIADPQRNMDDLVVRSAEAFREKQGIKVLTSTRALAIDAAAAVVSAVNDADGTFSVRYDRLLIATGADPIVPDLPGVRLPGVMPLKSLGQGRAIKAHLQSNTVRRAVLIGMGYIALEMSEALRTLGITVEMVKPRPDLLPWMERGLAATVRRELETQGVLLHTGFDVKEIVSDNGALEVRSDQRALSADMVLLAIGVRPNAALASDAGLDLGPAGAVAVDAQLRTSNDTIYAAGDCADAFHVVSGRRAWLPLALRANRAGWAAADNICGKPAHLQGVAGTAVFKVFDLQVARTGLTAEESRSAGFDPLTVTIDSHSRSHIYPGGSKVQVHMVGDQSSGRLLGVQMVGRESVAHRVNAAAVALHAGMTVAQFAQCDLAYAPPFGGVWDPLLIAANQLLKKL